MPVSLRRVLVVLGCLVVAFPLCARPPLPPPVHVTLSPQHWTEIPLPARAISLTHHGDEIWACGEHELIAVSRDGGSTWQVRHLAKSAEMLLAMTFADDQTGYAWGTDRLMLRSTDGGATWNPYRKAPGTILHAAFSDREHGLVLSRYGFATTDDGGVNWRAHLIPDQAKEPSGVDELQSVLVLDQHHAAVLFVAPDKKYGQLLGSTDDGAAHWRTIRFPASLHLQTLIHSGSGYGAYGCRDNAEENCEPVQLTSPDGQHWKFARKVVPKLDTCSQVGCMEGGNRAMVWSQNTQIRIPVRPPRIFDWTIGRHGICFIDNHLRCALFETLAASAAALPPAPAPIRPREEDIQCRACPQDDFFREEPRLHGSAVIAAWIDERGVPQDLTVRSASTAEIAKAAVSMVRNWRFRPAEVDHRPVRATVVVEVNAWSW